jgi:hypothetical protein
VFKETACKGRLDEGMPTWGGVLADCDIVHTKAFIDNAQMKQQHSQGRPGGPACASCT